jgi:hypothetical protein
MTRWRLTRSNLGLAWLLAMAGGCRPAAEREDLKPPAGFRPPPIRPLRQGPLRPGRIEFGTGFHPLESHRNGKTWRWMGKRGDVLLPAGPADTGHRLRLRGWVPLELLPRPPTVRISLGGRLLDSFRPEQSDFDRRHQIEPERVAGATALPLRIETDQTGQARGDPRELGVSIEQIEWLPIR